MDWQQSIDAMTPILLAKTDPSRLHTFPRFQKKPSVYSATVRRPLSFTYDGAGGIVEIDAILNDLWQHWIACGRLTLHPDSFALFLATIFPERIGHRSYGAIPREAPYRPGYVNKFASCLTPGYPDVIPLSVDKTIPVGIGEFELYSLIPDDPRVVEEPV